MTPPPPPARRRRGRPPRPRVPGWSLALLTLALFGAAGALFLRDATQERASTTRSRPKEERPQAEREVEIATEPAGHDSREQPVDGDRSGTNPAAEHDAPVPPPEARSLRGMSIAIDPAGGTVREGGAPEGPRVAVGGFTPSCLGSSKGGAREGAATLAAARELRDLLEAAGARVELTRDADDGSAPCTDERVAMLERADIAIVLGADSGHGWRVLPARPAAVAEEAPTAGGRAAAIQLARDIDGALDAGLPGVAGPDPAEAHTAAMSHADDVRRGELGAIDIAYGATSVFIDLGDFDVPVDAARLRDPEARAPLVRAIVVGLGTWAVRSR